MGMLDPGRFLISCPQCEAWPMSVNPKHASWSRRPHEVKFVCPRCRRQEAAIISASGALTPIQPRAAPSQVAQPKGRIF